MKRVSYDPDTEEMTWWCEHCKKVYTDTVAPWIGDIECPICHDKGGNDGRPDRNAD